MSNDYSFIIDNFVWSFSRLNSYHTCPYQFYLQYINSTEGEGNFFSEFGSHAHNILEKYAKNEVEIYELPHLFENQYNETITHSAPPNKFCNLNNTYFNSGKEYFENFEGFGDKKIFAVEKNFEFKIDDISLTGFVDLILEDKNGDLHIVDHKSSDPKSAKSKKAQEYWKQMSLYSIGMKEEYGVYPKQLHINAFRKQQWFTKDFDTKAVEGVKTWVKDTVEQISKEDKWLPKSDGFFCNFLCNFRNICGYKGNL